MKKLIVLLLLVSSLFSDTTTNMSTSVGCQQILQMDNKKLIVKSGCCSWHGGVCDCGSNGRVICCDGTYSHNIAI
jgi:hypothetical protein